MTDQTTDPLALLRDAENYLSALHGSVARPADFRPPATDPDDWDDECRCKPAR